MSDFSSFLCADTHCHLDDPALLPDLPDVVSRAKVAGIHPLIAPSESLISARRIFEIAALHDSVRPCVGVHPHKAAEFLEDQIPEFQTLAARPETVAIGEIGLDYFYEFSPREKQIRTLEFFLDLAIRRSLPACLHVRDKQSQSACQDDMLSLLKPRAGQIRGVIHCFSGTYDEAVSFLDLGLHLSFTGIITFKSADELRQTFTRLPADRILLETDSPYLAPVPSRGKRNEPAFLKSVFTLTASLRSLSEPDWSARLRQTQTTLFGENIDNSPAPA